MTLFINSRLTPLPESVLAQYSDCRGYLLQDNIRVALAPHSNVAFNMNLRGLFHGVNVQGAIDTNSKKRGEVVYGLEALNIEDVIERNVNILVIVDPRYRIEMRDYILSDPRLSEIKIIDLCEDYSIDQHRSDIARALVDYVYDFSDCRYPPGVEPLDDIQVPINPRWGLGDKLCALTAARYIARKLPYSRVWFPALREVQGLYSDGLVNYGPRGFVLREHYELFHRQRQYSPALNYLGCYLLGLAIDFNSPPALELPEVPPFEELTGVKYVALQPTSNWAQPNLSLEALCKVIAESPLPVVLVSDYVPKNSVNTKSKLNQELRDRAMEKMVLAGADARFIGSEMNMLRLIRHAHLLASPRSASAHIAAGYLKKSVIWLPNDGENWHLNYPTWSFISVNVEEESVVDDICSSVYELCYEGSRQ